MKPQTQLRKEPQGDCLRACIASLLEISIEKVPDFTTAPEIEGSPFPAFWIALQSWLGDKGLFFLEVQLPANFPWMPMVLPAFCIFFGETSKGVKHAIVGRVEEDQFIPVFNPWPEAELTGGVAALGFIVPRDPHLVMLFGRALHKISRLACGLTGPIGESIRTEAQTALGHQINGAGIVAAILNEPPKG